MRQAPFDFFDRVYDVVRQIPAGRVTSYGAIAKYLGAPKSARMVGYALGCSIGEDAPAHRVVNRVGLLTGQHHFKGSDTMQRRLEGEGIRIIDHRVQDFKSVFWDPMQALSR